MSAAVYDFTPVGSAQARGLRVVVCDPDPRVRAKLRSLVQADSALVLMSEAGNWQTCQVDLDSLLPELLIVRSGLAPLGALAQLEAENGFPVVIALREPDAQRVVVDAYGELPLPLEPEAARMSLKQAVTEIYNRKARQLSDLLTRYIAGLGEVRTYSFIVTVERDGQSINLSTHSILTILAARKCVWVHSLSGRFLVRKPIHQVADDLDPMIFVRIHRSVIVNVQYLDGRASLNDKLSHVVLTDGSKYPIGLNYRNSIVKLLKSTYS